MSAEDIQPENQTSRYWELQKNIFMQTAGRGHDIICFIFTLMAA